MAFVCQAKHSQMSLHRQGSIAWLSTKCLITVIVLWQTPFKTRPTKCIRHHLSLRPDLSLAAARAPATHLSTTMWPLPDVMKNRLFSWFQEISFTSKRNCSSRTILRCRTSMNDTRSSLFPTAIVWPFGDHEMLMFSPGGIREAV